MQYKQRTATMKGLKMFKSINGGLLPQRATRFSAGFDVFSNDDVVIGAGETKFIGLGVVINTQRDILDNYAYKINMKDDGQDFGEYYETLKELFLQSHYFALHIRSSLRAKGLTSLGTGIIDMDYRDEIKMVVNNPFTNEKVSQPVSYGSNAIGIEYTLKPPYEIKKGDKIGQLILCRHEGWLLPSEYTKDDERNGGFGSTDAKV